MARKQKKWVVFLHFLWEPYHTKLDSSNVTTDKFPHHQRREETWVGVTISVKATNFTSLFSKYRFIKCDHREISRRIKNFPEEVVLTSNRTFTTVNGNIAAPETHLAAAPTDTNSALLGDEDLTKYIGLHYLFLIYLNGISIAFQ